MLNSTNHLRVVNNPSPDQNFGKKMCEAVEKKFLFQKPKNIPCSTKTQGGEVFQNYQL